MERLSVLNKGLEPDKVITLSLLYPRCPGPYTRGRAPGLVPCSPDAGPRRLGPGTVASVFTSPSFSLGSHSCQHRWAFRNLLGFRRTGWGAPGTRRWGTEERRPFASVS